MLCAGFTRPITRAGPIICIDTPKGILLKLDVDCTVQADLAPLPLMGWSLARLSSLAGAGDDSDIRNQSRPKHG